MAERTLHGTGVTPRAGVGSVVWYGRDISLPDPDEADVDPDVEVERFAHAVETARAELESEREATAERVGEDEAAVFDAHIQFLEDPTIEEAVETMIGDGLPAP
ncbi:MAG: phosphoenolpyruvate-utilizing N-terminal domain-containing protein, partial [Haloarcula sp.]